MPFFFLSQFRDVVHVRKRICAIEAQGKQNRLLINTSRAQAETRLIGYKGGKVKFLIKRKNFII